jgi:hypothetical protein
LELHDSHFPELLNAIPSMTQRIVRVLLDRNREYTRAEEQIGNLAALNKLAANLAHSSCSWKIWLSGSNSLF